MKHFGKAMAVVRKAPRTSAGKVKSKELARKVSEMLKRVRSKDYIEADMIAKSIVDEH